MRAHLYTAVYRYIRPLPPPPPPAYRGATEGPRPPSYVGSSEERPCPDRGLCAPPSAPADAGAAVGGWALPPPDDCTCRVKPRLKSPPPRGGRRAAAFLRCAGRPRRSAPRAALPPRVALPRSCARPARPRREGGGAAPRRGGSRTTLSLTLALSLTPLTQGSSLWLPLCLHHRKRRSSLLPQTPPCSTLLPLIAEGWGGTSALPIPWPPCSPLTPLIQDSSPWLPPCLYHRKSCSTLLPQTLSCSTLLPLVAGGWGGTSTLPIPILEERRGGVWNPNFCVPKMAQIDISFCKFHFFPP